MKFAAFEPIDLKSNIINFDADELYVSQIVPDHNQARKNFDERLLNELAASIRKHGVIQPIIVRKLANTNMYELIAGERRWRAAKLVGLEKIPVIIKEYDSASRRAVGLIENIQRENLNPLELAQAIQCLLEECAMTHNQIAESIGKSRATVSNLLRLLNLENEVKTMINAGLLEMGHARALLSLNSNQQIAIAKVIVNKALSVRETEKIAQKIKQKPITTIEAINTELEDKIQQWNKVLAQKLSVEVRIHLNKRGEGRVVIPINSLDEIEWLVEHIRTT